MNKIQKITLFFTTICNAKCDHCYVEPLFSEQQTMSDELLNECVNVAIEWNVRRLAITGGEPVLFWDKLEEKILKASSNNITCSISTNAYWADSDENTYRLISKMKLAGVTLLELSTDIYHQKFVPIENIIRCIKHAQTEEISIIVRVCGEKIDDEVRTLSVLSGILKNKKQLMFQYTANYGQAKENKLCSKLTYDLLKNIRCTQIGQPIIMFNRDIYACCGPAISLKNKNKLYLGKFNKENSNELLNKIKNSSFVRQLQEYGPASLLKNYEIQKKYSSLCELCYDAMNERNNISNEVTVK